MTNARINLFGRLELETSSYCNRTCPTCIRNSIPDKESTSSWFTHTYLPMEIIEKVFDDCISVGFRGEVCLSHYNEPLADKRIVDIARLARKKGFSRVFMCSNADYLTDSLAKELDGTMHDIGFTIYMDEPSFSHRGEWVKSLFSTTKVTVSPGDDSNRMITHNSPLVDSATLSRKFASNPCFHPTKRMIVNYKGEMLLCCDDLTGHFDLGNVKDSSVGELWYSEKHQRLVQALMASGGRSVNEWCLSCPRK